MRNKPINGVYIFTTISCFLCSGHVPSLLPPFEMLMKRNEAIIVCVYIHLYTRQSIVLCIQGHFSNLPPKGVGLSGLECGGSQNLGCLKLAVLRVQGFGFLGFRV